MTGAFLAPIAASADDISKFADGATAPELKIQDNVVTGVQTAPNSFFVQFASEPTSNGGSLSAIRAERSQFQADVADAGVDVEVRQEFGTLWNGVSVDVEEDELLELASSGVVEAIFPMEIIEAPTDVQTQTIDPELFSAITMTGADVVQSELGYDGTGIKVGIIDTGIDIDHPDLGGNGTPGSTAFPSERVAYGYDLVGDTYNSDPSDPAYQPNPMPDPNPDDCQGHGTHVAGIVGADGEVTGVAPGVTFGAYRVFGCEGSTEGDVMLHAMELALRDGMDVVNMSIGSAFSNWAQYPTAQASDALAREGVVVAASIGNSGDDGVYSAGAPGVGRDTIGVGSVDNIEFMASFFSDENGDPVPYVPATGSPAPPTEGTAPVVAVAEPGTPEALACGTDPFTDAQKAVIDGNWVLIQRGTCSFYEKARNGQLAGAAGVIIYNNVPGLINPTVEGDPPVTVPVIMITAADGEALVADALAEGSTTITWSAEQTSTPSPTGGLMSSFSSFGTAADLMYKPDVAAPGGQIYSTYPLEKGAHATLSGTSMASPHVAGAAALMLEADPGLSVPEVKTKMQNSAEQLPLNIAPAAGLEVVHLQGAGMIHVDKAILADVELEPSFLQLGQTSDAVTTTLTLTNTTDLTEVYTMSFEPALGTAGTASDWDYYYADADVSFSADQVSVPAGGSATVDVTVVGPYDAEEDIGFLYGGYVLATGTDSSVYSVPVGGASFDLQQVEVLTGAVQGETGPVELPVLGKLASCTMFLGVDCVDPEGDWNLAGAGTTYTMDEGDVPTVLMHLEQQSRAMDWEVFKARADGGKGASLGLVSEVDYLERTPGLTVRTWDGKVVDDNGARVRVPDGDYVIEITITRAQAWNDDRDAVTETWTSPAFGIAWAGTGLVDSPTVDRAMGPDRYATAAELAVENFDAGVETVYIGSGQAFPDALSGSALAGTEGSPVLLTRSGSLPAATRMALQTLAPERIVVLGGPTAISAGVEARLADYAGTVERLAGSDRYATSAAVSGEYPVGVSVAFLASGRAFPDALSASAAAGVEDSPVLLTRPGSIPAVVAAELARLDPDRIVVLGGRTAVSDAVLRQARAYATDVVRIGGDDRYETSANVAAEFFTTPVAHAVMASGSGFADALAAAPVAAQNTSPVLLTRPTRIPAATLATMIDLRVQALTIAGGYSAVSLAVQEELESVVYP
ncbi:cell wall-binding repeat-containing protein [Ornithinimicrobium avium]|uniref:Peptidase S8 n=1 Tax=Ornithinimicrobium avium TaxID=2283195 RepID=A0A345NP74_9MICO|nr:cell wall-binding repeat-containing protein [Ornithinimicrobium avium]AXH96832.1 peptidase S8 [Ornithinimicrobium avium]